MEQDEAWLLRDKYAGVESKAYKDDCVRLRSGEPLAYVIGQVPFLNVEIYLDSHPLIPRPETEFWTAEAIAEMKNAARSLRVLDLCAGSGAIGIAVAKEVPHAHVDFAELMSVHLPTIKRNVRENGIDASRIAFYGSDLFLSIPQGTRYDYILSNPPYIDQSLKRTAKSVLDFEPHEALFGGKAGLELIERIIKESKGFLAEGGAVYLEHEPEQSVRIAEIASAYGFSVASKHDQYGILRWSVLRN